MIVEVKVPEVGESITEGVLVEWFKKDGELVAVDDQLFELETDKVTMQIQAQQAGRLTIEIAPGSDVKINQVVGRIDTDTTKPIQVAPPAAEPAAEAAAPATAADEKLSPAVRRLVVEHKLDPKTLSGSGKDGRITKADVLEHLQKDQQPTEELAKTDVWQAAPTLTVSSPSDIGQRQTRTKMSSLRRRLAERLVAVQNDSAILSTFNEADLSAVIAMRATFKAPFEKRHGIKLGFMSFFVKAAVEALRSVPALNAQIDGDEMVQNHFYDIGVAVGTDKGLVVPVIRDADRLSFAQVEATIADFAVRARNKKLTLDDLTGGCFTISNGGIYGSLLSTPILNPPQSGILGMHAIKKRAVVVEDEVVVRPMMYLAVSYDHRLVDGQEAVTFLRRIVDCIESPQRLLLEV